MNLTGRGPGRDKGGVQSGRITRDFSRLFRSVKLVRRSFCSAPPRNMFANFLPAFLEHASDWGELATVNIRMLRRMLHPLGLWRRRALSLKALAIRMAALHGEFPRDRREIETLPGIGQYSANAIMLFCHGNPKPLLDVNMARVLERCFGPRYLADIRYDPWLQLLSQKIIKHCRAREINWATLDLAATICTARLPHCGVCPLKTICRYAGMKRA